MARTYLVDSKRYQYIDFVPTVGATEYLLSEADNNKWIKIDTTNEDGDVQLPLNISEGFSCIIENTGPFTVNYLNEAGTSAATEQDLFTEDQYKTVEVAFNQNEWRIQGYIGRNDISSLYDVNVTAGGLPENEDVLTYNLNSGVWQAGKQPKFIPRSPENLDFIIQKSDHGKIIPVNTTFAPVDVAINTGLPAGFYCRVQNVGTGSMTITPGVTWNSPITSVNDQYAYIDIFHSGLEQYYVVSNEGLGSFEDGFIPSTSGVPITTPAAGTSRFDSGTNTLYIYNGTSWVSAVLT